MNDLTLTLADGLRLANNASATSDVRVLGALTVATILTQERSTEFTPEMTNVITQMLQFLAKSMPDGATT